MDGQNVIGASIVGHADSLFGSAMRANPGLISANGHHCQLEWALATQPGKRRAQGGVSAEDEFLAFAFEHVTVIATIAINLPSRTPVIDFKGPHLDITI